ncbi:MAG: hypothetical protein ACREUU_07315, partial [Gammaproteobacteria bacterium]
MSRQSLTSSVISVLPLMIIPAAAVGTEASPEVTVAQVLPAELKQSVHHSVEQVETDGRFYHYRVDTEFGAYTVGSTASLRILVEETAILSQAVNQFARNDAEIGDELRGQFSVSADSTIDILTRPVSTATDLAGQLADNLNETLTGTPGAAQPMPDARYLAERSLDPGVAMHRRNVAAQWGLDVYSSNPRVQEFLD